MKLTPIQKRAARKGRNSTALDMNLVALIDIFTILIFFLLSSATGVELLTAPNAAKLPEAKVEKAPKETVTVVVSGDDIVVQGRKVASIQQVLAAEGDVIAPLKDELELLAKRSPVVAAAAPPTPDGGTPVAAAPAAQQLTVLGDKDIPYRLLKKVMVTGARANYSDVSFAVRKKEV
ncbi:MAG TPA: biopolymer transporter ExbD [Methylibium sp.]|uniref:ExbD/TolR family protein n=1 Tax=Methylibium sp. TaxID=2067992 RepID=UPI002DB768BD|nr:biopolymer transporter ExbD [Methylibium sp.]HEU4458679.1 biopolymer transporter ExbD [Methylibium sp.]